MITKAAGRTSPLRVRPMSPVYLSYSLGVFALLAVNSTLFLFECFFMQRGTFKTATALLRDTFTCPYRQRWCPYCHFLNLPYYLFKIPSIYIWILRFLEIQSSTEVA